MSKYTTQLRWPIEQELNNLNLENSEENWEQVYKFVGLDDYPIYKEEHRSVLNNMIIRRYYFREIGFETWGQFKWMLRRTMFEIMPWYNQLYEALEMLKDPLTSKDMHYEESWDIATTNDVVRDGTDKLKETVDGSTTSNVDGSGTVNTESSGTTSDRNVFQDTPMNGLDTGAIRGLDYATNVTFDDGSSTDTTDSTTRTVTDQRGTSTSVTDSNRTEKDVTDQDGTDKGWRVHREWGYDIPLSDLLKKYRENFMNIDLEITDRLNDLFMGLW